MARGEIECKDVDSIHEPFEWQFGSLVESYTREVLSKNVLQEGSIKLKKAVRVKIKGVDNARTPIERKSAGFSGCY